MDVLIPNQAHDTGYEKGCRFAVYATGNLNMAICFALGCISDDPETAHRIMLPNDTIPGKNQ